MSQVPSTVLFNKNTGQKIIQNYSLISTLITVNAHIKLFKLLTHITQSRTKTLNNLYIFILLTLYISHLSAHDRIETLVALLYPKDLAFLSARLIIDSTSQIYTKVITTPNNPEDSCSQHYPQKPEKTFDQKTLLSAVKHFFLRMNTDLSV